MATLPPRRRGITLKIRAMPMKPVMLSKPKGEARWLPLEIWSGRRVSNSRPQPWQGCALPTELRPRSKRRIIAASLEVSNHGPRISLLIEVRPRHAQIDEHVIHGKRSGDVDQDCADQSNVDQA